jgi:triosephosphate isomerase
MKKYIIANWKSNKNVQELSSWLNNFPTSDEDKKRLSSLEIILALPFPLIPKAKEIIESKNLAISLAVQNLSSFGQGSYTGEISAKNLEFFNIEYVILGHSERRRFLQETSQQIADKVALALEAGFKPILCLDQPYFKEQASLIKKDDLRKCFLAYEPLAAIGSGQAFNLAKLPQVKEELFAIYPENKFIYGGSVDASNVASYLVATDGVLVGGASLDLSTFVDLLYAALQAVA